MRALRVIAAVIGAAALSQVVGAQPRSTDPWDPITDAAAEAAVARLGTGRALQIQSSVVTIPALVGKVGSGSTGIVATVQQVKQALNELGAIETAREVQVDLPADVLFEFDKADIRSEAVPSLEKVGTVLGGYPRSQVMIEGHSDGKGTSSYNQALSERRAVSVRKWFESRGLKDLRIQTRGLGAAHPVAPNANRDGSDNPEGRRKNRRVHIVITKAP